MNDTEQMDHHRKVEDEPARAHAAAREAETTEASELARHRDPSLVTKTAATTDETRKQRPGVEWVRPSELLVSRSGRIALVFAVGVVLLLIPVSVHSRDTDVGCGNALIRDPHPAENDALRHSADAWADLLEFGTDPYTGPGASTLCTDALTTRRWVAWTSVLLGAAAAGYGVASRRARPVSPGAAAEQQTPARHSSPLPPPPTPTPLSYPHDHTPFPTPPATPAGWYPDQTDPTRVRWFDGAGWTEATLPRGAERA
ncbi:DUF2510 domain-containing protein [Rhodococcus ruber]|uniref:DUF2510 domain-containing protein n=1 Tax=Rhodococcus ruber TaxID=1830 RepID=A0A098BGW1_9NOCA|nr:DUF2510 domain-containing protein [Rhodococcus ruber]ETT25798.1 Protein of unknown function DUF2510 [Rhodococcus rhodochrous ATCC 21198]MCD2129543.1 DUF2510 domain-containing protein [Rhodococcus ruber]MCZ4505412.1 DUF2510 domain-containing protein [Rhodococcus ruber]MCZ4532843.1 DUF2510 domain-containing protein [Rhodococcus ruber]MCZ4532890.1 DUF2510 domain-containing protein [Rhodococcus ruber]